MSGQGRRSRYGDSPFGFEDLEAYSGTLSGAWILSRPEVEMSPDWDPSPLRTPLEELLEPITPSKRNHATDAVAAVVACLGSELVVALRGTL